MVRCTIFNKKFNSQTTPLVHTLFKKAEEQVSKIAKINLSLNLNNEETLIVTDRTRRVPEPYKTSEKIPSGFLCSEQLKDFANELQLQKQSLPKNSGCKSLEDLHFK